MDFYKLSAHEIAQGVKDKEFSALDVFDSCVGQAVAHDGKIGAFITITMEEGRARAKRIDEKIKNGEPTGKLAGVPFAVKDNMTVSGVRTTAGSKILSSWIAPYDATVVKLLLNEDAVLMGKTNMDEFAMGSSSENSAFGPISNPWDMERVPGGSSGGSAASVAAGFVPFSLGSDTGGSIRQPAAFCGLQAMKPTYGMVSRYGLLAYGSSLDQIGPFTRNLDDLLLVLEILAQHDPHDSTSTCHIAKPNLKAGKRAKKVAIVKEFKDLPADAPTKAALEKTIEIFKANGIEIVEVSLPVTAKYALACYYAVAVSEANTNLARFDGVRYGYSVNDAKSLTEMYVRTRSEGFGKEVKRRILAGTYLTDPNTYDKFYIPALKVRHLMAEEFNKVFETADHILQPASPMIAFRKGELMSDPLTMYASDIYTIPVNLVGIPSLTFNTGYTPEGIPVGLQLLGKRWGDADLIETARTVENEVGSPKIAGGAQ